mmetsp:Transcript_98287/g.256776  ORF Transcript_98287/g.256776 Transcript_98287/m.256776 type:complete len:249 (-) Transcript_98287:591-1337(-)
MGFMQPHSTKYSMCCALPPAVALLMAHAASFLMSKSPVASRWTMGGINWLLITSWICALFPAVIFDIVQQVSFRMLFFVCPKRAARGGSKPQPSMAWVWLSSPVTMFPTARKAGVCTKGDWCCKSSTSRVETPELMTAAMRSLEPSERYDRAQAASVNTSTSVDVINFAKQGRAGVTHSSGGGGLPLHKLLNVHVAFRINETLEVSLMILMIGFKPPLCSTRSRKLGQSPAMLPKAQVACSRTSSFGD